MEKTRREKQEGDFPAKSPDGTLRRSKVLQENFVELTAGPAVLTFISIRGKHLQ